MLLLAFQNIYHLLRESWLYFIVPSSLLLCISPLGIPRCFFCSSFNYFMILILSLIFSYSNSLFYFSNFVILIFCLLSWLDIVYISSRYLSDFSVDWVTAYLLILDNSNSNNSLVLDKFLFCVYKDIRWFRLEF